MYFFRLRFETWNTFKSKWLFFISFKQSQLSNSVKYHEIPKLKSIGEKLLFLKSLRFHCDATIHRTCRCAKICKLPILFLNVFCKFYCIRYKILPSHYNLITYFYKPVVSHCWTKAYPAIVSVHPVFDDIGPPIRIHTTYASSQSHFNLEV